jgi:16S rRNA (guanine1207-N2)-methyltransferase
LTLVHWNRAVADELTQAGFSVVREDQFVPSETGYSEVWLLPDRQRECQLGELAMAWREVAVGGRLVVALRNDWGAKRLEDQWREALGVPLKQISKSHCRVFAVDKTAQAAAAVLPESWQTITQLRRLPETGLWSRPGLFSWKEPDLGSRLLAHELPEDLAGAGADLGMGWGFLSVELLKKCPEVRSLDGFELDARALECARRNLGNVMVPVRPRLQWKDVTTGVGCAHYDFVVMNPPFHEGRDADPGLGLRFITAAATALKPQGVLWMVANKQLPYETLLAELFEEAMMITQKFGFKVLVARGVKSKVHSAALAARRSRGGHRRR